LLVSAAVEAPDASKADGALADAVNKPGLAPEVATLKSIVLFKG
jgi:hypothetical protein